MTWSVGDVVAGKYEIVRLLGEGGMGVVYEVRHSLINRRYALKALHPEREFNEEAVARFVLEAQAATSIGSDHIVEVTDAGVTPDDVHYLVMELLEGEDLAQLFAREGPLDISRAVTLVRQVCDGLQAAHSRGIVHRDLKPENIFITRRPDGSEWIKLLDFGFAKVADQSLTETGEIFGTLRYMAPEQTEGAKNADHRTDIYSTGALLYELLVGGPAFDARSVVQMLLLITDEEPRPPRQIRPEIPAELERVVLKAMAKDRALRFQSMTELKEALSPFKDTHVSAVAPRPPANTPTRFPSNQVAAFDKASRPEHRPPSQVSTPSERLPSSVTPSKPRSSRWIIAVVALVLVVIVLGAGVGVGRALFVRRHRPTNVGSAADPVVTSSFPDAAPRQVAISPQLPSETRPRPALSTTSSVESRRSPSFVVVASGSFVMGSPAGEVGRGHGASDSPQHSVTLTRPYLIQTTEVTQGEWLRLFGNNPSTHALCGGDCPVENVTWFEALEYCNALSRSQGWEACYEISGCLNQIGSHRVCRGEIRWRGLDCRGYRLPTEAEWEFAARAGTVTATYDGDLTADRLEAESPNAILDPIAWFRGNSGGRLHPVERLRPNALRLYDMLGNVEEWVWDVWGPINAAPETDPEGPPPGPSRVVRGGSYAAPARQCRASSRAGANADDVGSWRGFRVVRTAHSR